MDVKVEFPKKEDWNRVNVLARQVHELHVRWRPDLFLYVEEVIGAGQFEEMIQEEKILVAKLQEEIVGYVTFCMKEKNHSGMRYRKYLCIDAICVDEKERGKGIGTLLLRHTRKIAEENGCTDLYLTVNEENEDAIKLYEKFGMKVKNIAYSMQIEKMGVE